MSELSKPATRVLAKAVEIGEAFTPTMVGVALGYEYTRASSRVAPALKELTEKGKLVRKQVRHNVVSYTVA